MTIRGRGAIAGRGPSAAMFEETEGRARRATGWTAGPFLLFHAAPSTWRLRARLGAARRGGPGVRTRSRERPLGREWVTFTAGSVRAEPLPARAHAALARAQRDASEAGPAAARSITASGRDQRGLPACRRKRLEQSQEQIRRHRGGRSQRRRWNDDPGFRARPRKPAGLGPEGSARAARGSRPSPAWVKRTLDWAFGCGRSPTSPAGELGGDRPSRKSPSGGVIPPIQGEQVFFLILDPRVLSAEASWAMYSTRLRGRGARPGSSFHLLRSATWASS